MLSIKAARGGRPLIPVPVCLAISGLISRELGSRQEHCSNLCTLTEISRGSQIIEKTASSITGQPIDKAEAKHVRNPSSCRTAYAPCTHNGNDTNNDCNARLSKDVGLYSGFVGAHLSGSCAANWPLAKQQLFQTGSNQQHHIPAPAPIAANQLQDHFSLSTLSPPQHSSAASRDSPSCHCNTHFWIENKPKLGRNTAPGPSLTSRHTLHQDRSPTCSTAPHHPAAAFDLALVYPPNQLEIHTLSKPQHTTTAASSYKSGLVLDHAAAQTASLRPQAPPALFRFSPHQTWSHTASRQLHVNAWAPSEIPSSSSFTPPGSSGKASTAAAPFHISSTLTPFDNPVALLPTFPLLSSGKPGLHSSSIPWWSSVKGPCRPCSTLPWSKEADEALAILHEEPISDRLRESLQRDWPADLVEEAVLSSLQKFDGPQLVKLCWAHAVAGVKSPEYFTHLAEALYSQMSHLSITDIANLLWAFSHLKIHHHELFAGLSEFIWEALDIAQCEDLRLICQAFADVDHYDDDQDLFDGIAQAAVLNITNFEPWQLCNLLWSFAQLRHASPLLFQIGMETLLPAVDALDLDSLGQLVAAYARMKFDLSPDTMTQLGDRAVHFFDLIAKSKETPTAAMSRVVWGFAVMGYDSRVLWDNARRAMSHQPVGDLGPADLGRLYFAHLKVVEMRRSGPKGPFNALLPANLLPASFAAWQHSVLAVPQEYVCRTWRIHTEELMHPQKLMENIRKGLQALRVDVGKPSVSLCGNFFIPLPIMCDQGIKVAVMVALPHQTTRNEPFQVLGEFQSTITELELRRWKVVPVMWYEWGQEDADDERQRIYLARQIETTLRVRL